MTSLLDDANTGMLSHGNREKRKKMQREKGNGVHGEFVGPRGLNVC